MSGSAAKASTTGAASFLGMDAGLLFFALLGTVAVVAVIYQIGSMVYAIINPPDDDAAQPAAMAPEPAVAKKKSTGRVMSRTPSKEKRCNAMTQSLMTATDVEAGNGPAKQSRRSASGLNTPGGAKRQGSSKKNGVLVEPLQPLMMHGGKGDECLSP